jgi:hypothetical protein
MHAGVPPLAGLCSYTDGAVPGYGVERTVALLRRYLYMEGQTTLCLAAHLNGVPEWEVKGALSLHLWQDAEHCTWLRNRVAEMRTPPLHLDRVPEPALQTFFQELLRSRTTLELLAGVYRVLKPAMIAAMKRHIAEANPLADQPTLRLLKFILMEEEEQVAWGARALDALNPRQDSTDVLQCLQKWVEHLQLYLAAAGGVPGDLARPSATKLPPSRAAEPFVPVRIPRRDERFTKLWNSRGPRPNADAPAAEWNWWNLYVRLTEMHVPELIALIMVEWQGQPWEFCRDLARHLWDEARHSMMGEIAFETRGVDWTAVPHEMSFAEFPNTQLEPRERYTLLWGIEQNAMKATGKRSQFETAQKVADPLSTTFHDFDWADEVLHTQIARKWLKPAFRSNEEMQQVFETVFQQYDDIRKEDMQLPRAGWWADFYQSRRAQQTGDHIHHQSTSFPEQTGVTAELDGSDEE